MPPFRGVFRHRVRRGSSSRVPGSAVALAVRRRGLRQRHGHSAQAVFACRADRPVPARSGEIARRGARAHQVHSTPCRYKEGIRELARLTSVDQHTVQRWVDGGFVGLVELAAESMDEGSAGGPLPEQSRWHTTALSVPVTSTLRFPRCSRRAASVRTCGDRAWHDVHRAGGLKREGMDALASA